MDSSSQSQGGLGPTGDDPEAPAPPPRSPRASPLSLLVGLLLIATLAQGLFYAQRWDSYDFYQFWVVGQAVRDPGTGDVWSQAERERLGREWHQAALHDQAPGPGRPADKRALAASRRQVLETYSTPWLYTLFGAAASGRYEVDLRRFQVFSLAALVLAAAALARTAGLSWAPVALFVCLVVGWFAPTVSDTQVGNVNRLQVALVALYLWIGGRERLAGRDLLAGVVLGLAAMFKPNLAFPILTLGMGWVLLGRWRKLVLQGAGTALGALAAFVLSGLWFGSAGAWRQWSAVLGELMGEYDHALSRGNFALARLLGDSTGIESGGLLALLFLGSLAAALAVRRRAVAATSRPDGREDLLLAGLGGAISVLTAKLAWLHYFLLVLPLAAALLASAASANRRVIAAVALLLVALEPFKDLLRLEGTEPVCATLVCGGALLLYLLGLFELATPARVSVA